MRETEHSWNNQYSIRNPTVVTLDPKQGFFLDRTTRKMELLDMEKQNYRIEPKRIREVALL